MEYDTLKICGACDVNYVMCSSLKLSDKEILNLQENGLNSPKWGADTIMLADFHEDLDANSFSITDEIIGYKIQRYEIDYDKLYDVATLNNDVVNFSDYNIRNNKSYQHRIIPIYLRNGVEVLGAPISTDTVYTDWCGWSVIGIKPTREKNKYTVDYDNIWYFAYNIEAEPMHPVYNKNYITGFGQFPKAVQGQENYLEGGLTCLIGDIDCENYVGDNIDMIEKWRDFCNNGELKLLKDIKGHVIPCSIKDTTFSNNSKTLENITTISFKFVQLKDKADISVYGLEV